MGISHVTLIARERGEGEWEETYHWWEQNGWRLTNEQAAPANYVCEHQIEVD
jgi:hypothetical protein